MVHSRVLRLTRAYGFCGTFLDGPARTQHILTCMHTLDASSSQPAFPARWSLFQPFVCLSAPTLSSVDCFPKHTRTLSSSLQYFSVTQPTNRASSVPERSIATYHFSSPWTLVNSQYRRPARIAQTTFEQLHLVTCRSQTRPRCGLARGLCTRHCLLPSAATTESSSRGTDWAIELLLEEQVGRPLTGPVLTCLRVSFRAVEIRCTHSLRHVIPPRLPRLSLQPLQSVTHPNLLTVALHITC